MNTCPSGQTGAVRRRWFQGLGWWPIAATFLVYFAVMIYSELVEPRRLGVDVHWDQGALRITRVEQRSPAGRAGLRVGDRILRIRAEVMRDWIDWKRAEAQREPGRAEQIEVQQGGESREVEVVPGRHPGDPWARLEKKRYVQVIVLAIALALMAKYRHRHAAVLGAWVLASVGTAPVFPGAEMTAVWRRLPGPIAFLLWVPQISHMLLLPLLCTWFAVLPRPLFRSTWPWLSIWAPALVLVGWWLPRLYRHVYLPPVLDGPSRWDAFLLGGAVLLYGGGGLCALAVNYRRLAGPAERRRMRALWVGALIGVGPTVIFLTALFWATLTPSPWMWFFVSTPYRLFALGSFLAFPIGLLYAAIRHRFFEL